MEKENTGEAFPVQASNVKHEVDMGAAWDKTAHSALESNAPAFGIEILQVEHTGHLGQIVQGYLRYCYHSTETEAAFR